MTGYAVEVFCLQEIAWPTRGSSESTVVSQRFGAALIVVDGLLSEGIGLGSRTANHGGAQSIAISWPAMCGVLEQKRKISARGGRLAAGLWG